MASGSFPRVTFGVMPNWIVSEVGWRRLPRMPHGEEEVAASSTRRLGPPEGGSPSASSPGLGDLGGYARGCGTRG